MNKISIIIPTYNREKYVIDSIKSAINQNFNLEYDILIVDDGSIDNTKYSIMSLNSKKIKYIYKENGGVSSAINKGIFYSDSEYILILASDNLLLPNTLSIVVDFLDKNQEVSFCCGQFYTIDANGKRTRNKYANGLKQTSFLYGKTEYMKLLFGIKDIDCFVIRKDCLVNIGLYNENYRMSEDWELLFRLTSKYNIGYIAQPLQLIRIHNNSLTTQTNIEYAENVHEEIIQKELSNIHEYYTAKQYYFIHKRAYVGMYLLFARTCGRNKKFIRGIKYILKAISMYPLIIKNKILYKTFKEFIPYKIVNIFTKSMVKINLR